MKKDCIVSKYNGLVRNANLNRPCKYQEFLHEINYDESEMPMKLFNIPSFERKNQGIAVNVIRYVEDDMANAEDEDEEQDIYHHSRFHLAYRSINLQKINAIHLNLLLIEKSGIFHYIAVTDLNRLLNTHQNGYSSTPIYRKWCSKCLTGFRKTDSFDKHLPLCHVMRVGATIFTMPEHDRLSFSDSHKSISPTTVIYADFESILVKPQEDEVRVLQYHHPIAASFLMIQNSPLSSSLSSSSYKEFYGPTCIVDFLNALHDCACLVYHWYQVHGKFNMKISQEEANTFENSSHCYICNVEFQPSIKKIRDHDHFTGNFLGASCNKCNLQRRIRKPFLPVVFHNLSGYDMHHIMKYAVGQFKNWNFSVIAKSSEKFTALTISFREKTAVQLRFIDSLQFLNLSLSKLVDILPTSERHHTNSLNDIPDIAKLSKGIFPYSFASSKEILEKPRSQLPLMEAFADELTGTVNITLDDYRKACETWRHCKCNTLKDYMMIYLKLDVYLLADVFESFRSTALMEDNLDPLHFYSIPGLSWSSALKSLPFESLQLLIDKSMYEFFEEGIRGGMTFVNKHYAKRDDHTQLLYINNLYGWALSQKLPTHGFE